MSARRNRGTEAIPFTSNNTFQFFSSDATWGSNARPPYDPRKKCGNGTESGREDRIALPRIACARIIHGGRESRSRGSVRVRTAATAGSLGRFPRVGPIRVQEGYGDGERDGKGRARLSSGAYGQPTGKTKLKMPLVSLSSVRVPSLSLVFLFVRLARSLASASFSLSSSRSAVTDVPLGRTLARSAPSEKDRIPVVERGTIATAKRMRGCDYPSSRFPR